MRRGCAAPDATGARRRTTPDARRRNAPGARRRSAPDARCWMRLVRRMRRRRKRGMRGGARRPGPRGDVVPRTGRSRRRTYFPPRTTSSNLASMCSCHAGSAPKPICSHSSVPLESTSQLRGIASDGTTASTTSLAGITGKVKWFSATYGATFPRSSSTLKLRTVTSGRSFSLS